MSSQTSPSSQTSADRPQTLAPQSGTGGAKVFVITGASSGIGRAACCELLGSGKADIVIGVDRDPAGQPLPSLPGKFITLHQDVLAADFTTSLQETIDQVITTSPEGSLLKGVVVAAGIQKPDTADAGQGFWQVVETNLLGAWRTTAAVMPYLRAPAAREVYKHIILLSSICAQVSVTGYAGYAASKAGLESLTRSLALSYGRDRILVNALAPGWVATPMLTAMVADWAQAKGVDPEVIRNQGKNLSPLRRLTTPEEIASMIGYLVADHQHSITGQVLAMNNGVQM